MTATYSLRRISMSTPRSARTIFRPHVVIARQLVGQDDDVRQRRVAGAELLRRTHDRLRLAESAGVWLARTGVPSFKSRIAW